MYTLRQNQKDYFDTENFIIEVNKKSRVM